VNLDPPLPALSTQPEEPRAKRPAVRLLFMDNLRWTVIILVLSMHAADTYSPLGNWYFIDRQPLTAPALLFFAAWQMYLQAFFMGLLFFIAGFFVPSSFDRKGPRDFLRDRAFRLGWPVLFYMFLLGPLTEYYVAHSWTSTEPTSFANEWLKHIRNGQFLQENGPLWFCLGLLIFSVGYTALQTFYAHSSTGKTTEQHVPDSATLICFALLIAAVTFLIRLAQPPSVLNLPLKDFGQYSLLFGVGILSARRHLLTKLELSPGIRWIVFALTIGFAAWLTILITGGALRGEGHAFSGGWHWQSAAFSVWESFTCVALCYGLIVLFSQEYNRQGRISRFLTDNAFSVYVFHPPILIVAARMLHGVPLHPILKFLLLTVLTAIASFTLSATVFRRLPVLQRIL
jgi:glucans biosynthesis protein C